MEDDCRGSKVQANRTLAGLRISETFDAPRVFEQRRPAEL